jgi:hypothetical protein
MYVIGGRARRKTPPERPSYRWVDNINMGLAESGRGDGWIDLAQVKDR